MNNGECAGCSEEFARFERYHEDHVVRFPEGLDTLPENRLRYCSPECFVENYNSGESD